MANQKRYPFHLMLARERVELDVREVNLASLRTYVYRLSQLWGTAFRVTCMTGDTAIWVERLSAADAAKANRHVMQADDQPAGLLYYRAVANPTALNDYEYANREAALATYALKVETVTNINRARLREHDPRFRRHFEGWVLRDSVQPVRVFAPAEDDDDED